MVQMTHTAGPTGSQSTSIVSFEDMGVTVSVESMIEEVWSILASPQGHMALESTHLEGETRIGPLVIAELMSDTTYSPSLKVGPFTRWCDGETWVTDSVTQTVVSDGTTLSSPTESWEGEVEGINQSLTTDAGTFQVVTARTVLITGEDIGGWTRQSVSIADGVLIREEIYASTGERIGYLEAVNID